MSSGAPAAPNLAALRRNLQLASEAEVALRYARANALFAEATAARNRALLARDIIIRAAEAGDLETSARRAHDGHMVAIPAETWNSEQASKMFLRCSVTLHGALSPLVQDGLLFVRENSLDALKLVQPFTEAASSLLPDHLSPYLKCMLSVAKRLAISPANQVNKASLEAEMKTEWSKLRSQPPAPTDVSWMATLIREPESKGGRGGAKAAERSRSARKK